MNILEAALILIVGSYLMSSMLRVVFTKPSKRADLPWWVVIGDAIGTIVGMLYLLRLLWLSIQGVA